MAAAVQAFGTIAIPDDASESVTVMLNLADAFGVGHSLIALTHNPLVKMPDDTKEIYRRVGRQILAAAKSEAAERIALAAASAAGRKAGAKRERGMQCDFCDSHDPIADLPTGNKCRAVATHRIKWADGRFSYGCDAHLEIEESATVKPVSVTRIDGAK